MGSGFYEFQSTMMLMATGQLECEVETPHLGTAPGGLAGLWEGITFKDSLHGDSLSTIQAAPWEGSTTFHIEKQAGECTLKSRVPGEFSRVICEIYPKQNDCVSFLIFHVCVYMYEGVPVHTQCISIMSHPSPSL